MGRILVFMWDDPASTGGQCPALYSTDGGYVVQGVKLTDEDRTQLRNLADNEDAVFVPAAVLDVMRGA